MPKVLTVPDISFEFQVPFRLNHRNRLRLALNNLFAKEKRELSSLTYVFCDDNYLLNINQRFLNHDYFTDIITFDLTESAVPGIVGEIYVSIDRVKENAGVHKVQISNELHRVIFHGALHLCGYRDKSAAEAKSMRQAEDKYLKLFERST